jgi:hypothetical protein
MELFTACQAEAKEPPINLSTVDPSLFMPPPMGIRSVLKMSDLKVREASLRPCQKEIKTLIDAKTITLDKPRDGEAVIPTMETNKVKIKSDGSLDKLANVRGRIFTTLSKVYGDIWPEFKDYCGRPLRLVKSMYGMTYSGKYWYLDLKD